MAKIPEQKTAEQWLEETAPQKKLAVFKLFLGYAPGVGKTFNMLSEGIRRHSPSVSLHDSNDHVLAAPVAPDALPEHIESFPDTRGIPQKELEDRGLLGRRSLFQPLLGGLRHAVYYPRSSALNRID